MTLGRGDLRGDECGGSHLLYLGYISGIILNPVCFIVSFHIPNEVSVKVELTVSWLRE